MGGLRGRTSARFRHGGALRRRSRPAVCSVFAPCALLLTLLGSVAPPLAAQSAEDLRRAAVRLRSVESTLEPLPDSRINRDAGEIAIIEHDGSSYDDRLPDGTLNYEARTRVGRRFYETHPDAYDFLVVFTNFEFQTSDATAFHLFGRNDVEGIGKLTGSAGPSVFGSPSRLKGWIDMAAVSRYRQRPLSLSLGDPGFLKTLGVLAHEMGHQWLAEARYRVGDTESRDLLGADEAHWSYLLDSDGSFLYGADWRANGDGTFTAARVSERYSALDLYLMGLLPKEKVPPLTLLRNPAVDRQRINREGEVVAATGTSEILIQQLIDAMGPRRPDYVHAQKEFRLGFVFLTKPGTEPAPEDLEAVERVRRAFGAHFFALTNGVGWADTSLATPPPAPRAASPDLARALAWLAARQALDGSWSDSAETRVRDTSSAVQSLRRAGAAGPTALRGLVWLQGVQPESLDFQARAAAALEPGFLLVADRSTRVARVLGGQNPDGGFGAGPDFASDPLDTALALRALKALGHPEDERVRRAVAALDALAGSDGGWPAVPGGETSTVVTAEVLLALLDWSEVPGSAAPRSRGLAALLARRNPDGGFGASPSTPHATALALDVLLGAGAAAELVESATAWLQREQLADGSWAASAYQTALVLGALGQSTGANLVVPADALTLVPNPVPEGEVVRVTARVRNAGRAAAPATVARLHDGDPSSSARARGGRGAPARPGRGDRRRLRLRDCGPRGARGRSSSWPTPPARCASRARTTTPRAARSPSRACSRISRSSPRTSSCRRPCRRSVRRRCSRSPSQPRARARRGPAPSRERHRSAGRDRRPAAGRAPALAPGQAAPVAIPWSPAVEETHVVRVARRRAVRGPGVRRDQRRRGADGARAGLRPGAAPTWRWRSRASSPPRSRSCRRRSRSGPSSKTRAARPCLRPSPWSTPAPETSARHRLLRRGGRSDTPRARPGHGIDPRRAAARCRGGPRRRGRRGQRRRQHAVDRPPGRGHAGRRGVAPRLSPRPTSRWARG